MSWQLWAIVSAIAAGATSVFAKAGLENVPPNLGNAVRTGIVLILSLLVLVASGEHTTWSKLNQRTWMMLALSAATTAVSWMAYFKALAIGSATPVTAIDKASLVVTMACAVMFLGEAFSWRAGLGVVLIVLGAILASGSPR
jgi:bacterial/archaeal transporter family protein